MLLKPNNMKNKKSIQTTPLFISFEGPEGAGKSTQAHLLQQRLQEVGYQVLLTREPGGTPLGSKLRELLLNIDLSIDQLPELLIYSASRAQLVSEVIRPALAEKKIVLCDRFIDSTFAYQGAGRGLPHETLQWLTERVTAGLLPNITFLLDIEAQQGLERAAQRGAADRLEQAGLDFHKRVRAGFLQLAEQQPQRFVVLNAQQNVTELSEQIWQVVEQHLGQRFMTN